MRLISIVLFMTTLTACGGNHFGFARTYTALSEERDLLRTERDVTFEDVRRTPQNFKDANLGWFGVVTDVSEADNGRVRVLLSYRIHQDRHLCYDERVDSCRVTVSDRETGQFTALLTLHAGDDDDGRDRLAPGSLIKLYGSTTGDLDAQGGPVIDVHYYRHWPRGTYVTTADREHMRR